jgi:hypothetical protein
MAPFSHGQLTETGQAYLLLSKEADVLLAFSQLLLQVPPRLSRVR